MNLIKSTAVIFTQFFEITPELYMGLYIEKLIAPKTIPLYSALSLFHDVIMVDEMGKNKTAQWSFLFELSHFSGVLNKKDLFEYVGFHL